jgi:hypothetical protein
MSDDQIVSWMPEAMLSRERLDELVAEYHRQRGWDT